MPIRTLFYIRSRARKGFVLDGQRRLSGPHTILATYPIDKTTVCDRHQPWAKRPSRVVGVSNGMDGHQNVLDRVFHVVRVPIPSRSKRTEIRCYLLQQSTISRSVSLLGTRHEDGPIDVTDARLRLLPAVGSAARGSVAVPAPRDELQRRNAAGSLLGHLTTTSACRYDRGAHCEKVGTSRVQRTDITRLFAVSEGDGANRSDGRATASAAQGRWKLAHPSGTTSWITAVIMRRPSAAKRVARPSTSRIGSVISARPVR